MCNEAAEAEDDEEEEELGEEHVEGEVGGLGVVDAVVVVSESELEEQVKVLDRWVGLGLDE